MKKYKPIILLYPPPSDPTQPYSSLPTLTGYLRSRGFTVNQIDLGIELFDEILSPRSLLEAHHFASKRANETDLSMGKSYLDRFYGIINVSEYIIQHIDEAKDVMRNRAQFYNLERYQWAVRLLRLACDLASLPYHPTILRPNDYETHYEPTFKGLLEATSRRTDNMFFDIFEKGVVSRVVEMDPLLVGISVTYRSQLVPAFTLSRLLKLAGPETHICIGGAEIHHMEEQLLNDSTCFQFADSFCVGEGETALSTLAENLSSDEKPKSVPNMIVNLEGHASANNLRFYEDVNSLPCPDFDGLDFKRYLSPEPVLLISSSEGCYYGKCAFCNVSMNTRRFYRQMEEEHFIANIKELYQKYGAKRFIIGDDAMPPRHMLSLSELVKNTLHDVTWTAEARFEEKFTLEFISALKEGGCRLLIFGLESASQRVLIAMNKGNSIERDTAIIKACSANGLYVDLQTFLGFPTETPEEADETINYLINNERSIASFGLGPFSLEKDTPVYLMPGQYGVGSISIPNDIKLLSDHYDYVPINGLTMEDIKKEYKSALEILHPIFSTRTTFLTITHNLLQFSHFGYDEIYYIWNEMDKPQWIDTPEIDNLVLAVSRSLILARPPRENILSEYTAFCTKTGKHFHLSPNENRLLELCDDKRTVGEIIRLWINEQTQEFEAQIILLARGYAIIREFLRKGLLLANSLEEAL